MKKLMLLGACAALVSTSAWSQIKIGQTAGFSGAVAATVKEATDGKFRR